MNIALTRAKYGLIIIGKLSELKKSYDWNKLIQLLIDENLVFKSYDDFENMLKATPEY